MTDQEQLTVDLWLLDAVLTAGDSRSGRGDEDKLVAVDFNLVATEDGEFVEVQGSGEEATFAGSQLDEMLLLARKGVVELIAAQRAVLARIMVSPPEI